MEQKNNSLQAKEVKKTNRKKTWDIPSLKKLDITKTLGGTVAAASESAYNTSLHAS